MNKSHKTKKKRNLRIFTVVFLLVATGFLARHLVKAHQAKWGCILQSHMHDFNGDGKQDMLINYCAVNDMSAMKLVDVESGETIWKSESKVISISNSEIAIFEEFFIIDYLYLDRSDTSKNNIKSGIEAFNSKTGDKIWEKAFENFERTSSMVLSKFNNSLLVVRGKSQIDTRTVFSINQNNGIVEWQAEIPGTPLIKPIQLDNQNLLFNDLFLYYILNTETKQYTSLTELFEVERILQYDNDEILFLMNDSLLYKYDTAFYQLTANGIPLTYEWDNCSHVAIYGENLITINAGKTSDNNYFISLTSNPLNDKGKKQNCILDPEIQEIENYIFMRRNKFHPQFSAFNNITTRFVPLLANTDDSSKQIHKKLIVFDLDSMLVSSVSQYIDSIKIMDIVFNKNHYALNIGFYENGKFRNSIALIDGKTGELTKSVEFISPRSSINVRWGDEKAMFSGDYIYGWESECAWCLSFPELELVYSTNSKLKIVENANQIKELFKLK